MLTSKKYEKNMCRNAFVTYKDRYEAKAALDYPKELQLDDYVLNIREATKLIDKNEMTEE